MMVSFDVLDGAWDTLTFACIFSVMSLYSYCTFVCFYCYVCVVFCFIVLFCLLLVCECVLTTELEERLTVKHSLCKAQHT